MSDQNTKSVGTPKGILNRGFAMVIILVALAILLEATLTACNLMNRKKTAGAQISTSILSPQMGDVVDISQPIEISATSACNDGVTRLEFYVDGVPTATQNTTLPGGSNPLFLSSLWTPQTAGQHVLMARGYTKDNRFSDSSTVFVSVNAQPAPIVLNVDTMPRPQGAALPSLNDLADKSGVSVSELVNANPALSGTDPKAPLPPGTTLVFPPAPPAPTAGVAGGPSATATPTPTAGAPSGAPAPGGPTGLTAAADCNSTQLSWNDRPDEEQYVVYRISPGSTSLSPITTLAANTTSYRDSLPGPGVYFYQVASRHGGQESLSQMVSVQPTSCPAPTQPSTTTDLTLTVVDLETTEPFEGAFCYVTFSNGASTRYPFSQHENFRSVAGDPRLYSFRAAPFTLSHYAAWPLNRPFSAHVECLGVTGSYAPSLGSININRRPSDWDERLLTDSSTNGRQGNFTLRYCLSIIPGMYCRDISYGSPPHSSSWSEADIRPGVVHDGPAPYNLQLEPDNWQGCMRQFSGGAPLQGLAGCLSDAVRYGATLHWNWQEQPPNFMAADLTGFHVILGRQSILTHEVLPSSEYDIGLWEMLYPEGTVPGSYYFIRDHADYSPSACSIAYVYSVEAVFRGGRRSPPSVGLAFNTDPCFLPADVIVNFDTLTINEGAVDQGDYCVVCLNDDTTFELRGTIEVISGSHNWSREINTPLVSGGTLFMESTDVVHVTDPHQTITINVSVYDYDEPTPLRAAAYEAIIPCTIRFELPAGTTEDWRHTHLHLIDSCDYSGALENLTFTVVLSVDGPR